MRAFHGGVKGALSVVNPAGSAVPGKRAVRAHAEQGNGGYILAAYATLNLSAETVFPAVAGLIRRA